MSDRVSATDGLTGGDAVTDIPGVGDVAGAVDAFWPKAQVASTIEQTQTISDVFMMIVCK